MKISTLTLFVLFVLACDSRKDDSTPADSDADADADADSDVDTDADADPCSDVPSGCCSEACPCAKGGDRCVATYEGAVRDTWGVCKPEKSGPECWTYSDCTDREFCAGVVVCPCGELCTWESPGTCSPVSGACCDSTKACPDHYFCLEFPGSDTCHGLLGYPQCWTDVDCFGGTCEGELLCSCDMNCISRPGTCSAGG